MTKKSIKSGQKSTGQQSRGTKNLKPWVVALDPYSDLDIGPALEYLRPMAERAGARLLGAFILGPESFNWTGEFSGPWIKKYKPIAESKAAEITRRYSLPVEVVPCRQPGIRHSVATLSQFAKKVKADFLIVFTHGRFGVDRMVLGSFTESLILASKTPVLTIHPGASLPTGRTRILMPTDLAAGANKIILKVAELAMDQSASVNLLYKQPDPLDPIIQQGVYAVGGGWVSVQSYIDDDMKEKDETLKKMVLALKKRGLEADGELVAASEPLVQAVLSAAKRHGSTLIALQTSTGPVAAAILGSVARTLVRESKIPVLVWK